MTAIGSSAHSLSPWESAQLSAQHIRMSWVTNGSMPDTFIVTGSGIGCITEAVEVKERMPYSSIPHFPHGKIDGHGEELVLGTLFDVPVLVLVGRVHLYQGFTPNEVAHHCATMAALGCKAGVITNASGCVCNGWKAGRVMLVKDHISFTQGPNCLIGPTDGRSEQFPDPNGAYDAEFQTMFRNAFTGLNVTFHEGVFAGLYGPSYETWAETLALRSMGVGAAGMSLVQEVLMLHSRGVRVAALSIMVNLAGGGPKGVKMEHKDVTRVAHRVTRGQVLPALKVVLPQMQQALNRPRHS